MREWLGAMLGAALSILIVIAVALGISVAMTSTRPYFLDHEREAVEHSRDFVESKRSEMAMFLRQYDELEIQKFHFANDPEALHTLEVQQRGILVQMWDCYRTLPDPSVLGPEIHEFMTTHPLH